MACIPDAGLGCVFHDSPGNSQPLFFGEMVWDFIGYPDQTVRALFPLPAVIVGHLTRFTFSSGGKDDVTFKKARALFRVAIIVHIVSKGCQCLLEFIRGQRAPWLSSVLKDTYTGKKIKGKCAISDAQDVFQYLRL